MGKVVVNDAPWRALLKRVVESREMKARVGLLGDQGGGDIHDDGAGSDATIVEIGAFQEFGTRDIPERSFIRSTFYERIPSELRAMMTRLGRAIVDGKMTAAQAIGALGAWGAAAVKNTITQTNIQPELAPATIAAKGSSKPLVDTGQLLGAISWDVEG